MHRGIELQGCLAARPSRTFSLPTTDRPLLDLLDWRQTRCGRYSRYNSHLDVELRCEPASVTGANSADAHETR